MRRTIKRTQRLAVAYARFSTEYQGSTEEQGSINEGIAVDEDITIVEPFADEGISRDISGRPGLLRMFEYLQEHPEIGFIIVNELERLTSGVNQRADVAAMCKRLNVTIVTEDIGMIDPHDEEKMQEADERAVAARREILKGRRRTTRNLRAKVVNKKTVALRPPYGIRMKPLVLEDGTELPSGARYIDEKGKKITSGEIELHPDEHPWLLKIFEWAYEGKSLEKIAKELNALGVKSKSGRQWQNSVVGQVLSNPLYKGEMTWGKRKTLRDQFGNKFLEERDPDDPGRVTFESPLGAIIDPEMWDTIEQRRQERAGIRRRDPLTNNRQVLDHFVFCGRCGNKMYGRWDNPKSEKRAWRFACHAQRPGVNPVEGFTACTEMNSILEKNIFAALAGVETTMRGKKPQRLGVTVQKGNTGDDLELRLRRLEKRRNDAKAEIGRAEDLAIDGLISKDKLIATREKCEAVLVEVEAELATLSATPVAEVGPYNGSTAAIYAELVPRLTDESRPVGRRRQLLRDAGLERVYVDGPNLRIHIR